MMRGAEKPNRDVKMPKSLKANELELDDVEFEQLLQGRRGYEPEDKVKDSKYSAEYVREMEGREFNLLHVQKEGFDFPVLVRAKEGLHIKIPTPGFTVRDIRACVGSNRLIDVMDTKTQINQIMTMKQFHKYWSKAGRRGDKILNVISLEFSHTRLENFVKAPLIVRQLDWTDRVWPRHLKLMQTEGTNAMEKMMYPKVQKYVLMSVRGCYTDFHVDFGGTSVWYHILKGKKVFFLIPPTPRNLQEYKKWTLSGEQNEVFFGDKVEKCGKIVLEAGQTFFIPTGWIHAVYTPEDSIIFGGNFLHSFNIQKQLEIAVLEEMTHVPQKFRYPFFTEMLWYTLDRYVQVLLGRSYICGNEDYVVTSIKNDEGNEKNENDGDDDQNEDKKKKAFLLSQDGHQVVVSSSSRPRMYVTRKELDGLKAIVVFLHRLPCPKKLVPQLVTDPVGLIRDVVRVVREHQHDDQCLAMNGKPLLLWADEYGSLKDALGCNRVKLIDPKTKQAMNMNMRGNKRRTMLKASEVDTFHAIRIARIQAASKKVKRRRRQRCKECTSCKAEDCGKCVYCLDMVKFGGQNRLKQTCAGRQCIQPVLSYVLVCELCETRTCSEAPNDPSGGLFECVTCGGVSHQSCMARKYPDAEPLVIRERAKEWQCNKCAARDLPSSGNNGNDDNDEDNASKEVKLPPPPPPTVSASASSSSSKLKGSGVPTKSGRGRPRGGGMVGKRGPGRPPANSAAAAAPIVGGRRDRDTEGPSSSAADKNEEHSSDEEESVTSREQVNAGKSTTRGKKGRPAGGIKRGLVRADKSPKTPPRGAKRLRSDSVDGRHNLRAKKMKTSKN